MIEISCWSNANIRIFSENGYWTIGTSLRTDKVEFLKLILKEKYFYDDNDDGDFVFDIIVGWILTYKIMR